MAQVGKKETSVNAAMNSPLADQISSADSLDYSELLGGSSSLSTVNSGFNKLFDEMSEIKKEAGDDLKAFNLKLVTDQRLSAFGDIIVMSATVSKQIFAVVMLPGDATVQRNFKAANAHMGSGQETVTKTIDDIVRQTGENGASPFRTLVHDHLASGTDIPENMVFIANSYSVHPKQVVDAKSLMRACRFDIINYLTARTGVTSKQVAELMGTLSNDLSVDVTRSMSPKDSLGNPQFAPITIALNQKVNQPFGGGSTTTSRVAEVRGYMDALPLAEQRAHALRVAKANASGVGLDQIEAPRLKPIFVARGVEWLSNRPGATLEGMISSLAIIAYLAESPSWLTASISEKENGVYDMASVGYYAPNGDGKPVSPYHDRKFIDDAGKLQAHIQKFWDTITVAIDVPLSGVGKTVLEALGSTARVNKALQAVYGPNAKLLQGEVVVDTLGSFPVGVYNDKGVVRDTRALTNTVSVATRYQGDANAIAEFMQTYWSYDSTRSDSIYAARLMRLKELAGASELTIRGEDVRLILSDELINVLRANLAATKVVSTHTVQAQQDSAAGFGGNWGNGIAHGGQSGAAGNNAFTGFKTFL